MGTRTRDQKTRRERCPELDEVEPMTMMRVECVCVSVSEAFREFGRGLQRVRE